MSDDNETPMERFENLAKRLFSIVKKDEEKVEQAVKDRHRSRIGSRSNRD